MSRIVTHLIAGLGKGGAETMLYQILKYKSDQNIESRVISMGGSSYYEDKIKGLNILVTVIPFKKHPLSSVFKIASLLKDTDVLCCWMYHANFIGYISGKMARVKKIVWNIRHSDLSPELNRGLTLRINKWCAKRSNKVSAVVYNGNRAKDVHEAIGYSKENSMVLDNGVDTDVYIPNPDAKAQLCTEFGIDKDKKIILSVTRYHPTKDVPTFIEAVGEIHAQFPDTLAVMCGNGIEPANEHIARLCTNNNLKIGKNIFLLGLRDDVPCLMAGCDLYVLHSAGEAFPNTLIQAMACGCLCLASDVGDVRRILDSNDFIVAPRQSQTLQCKMKEMLQIPEFSAMQIKERNRMRVKNLFCINSIAQQYERLFL